MFETTNFQGQEWREATRYLHYAAEAAIKAFSLLMHRRPHPRLTPTRLWEARLSRSRAATTPNFVTLGRHLKQRRFPNFFTKKNYLHEEYHIQW